jgi:hypothetical protein
MKITINNLTFLSVSTFDIAVCARNADMIAFADIATLENVIGGFDVSENNEGPWGDTYWSRIIPELHKYVNSETSEIIQYESVA